MAEKMADYAWIVMITVLFMQLGFKWTVIYLGMSLLITAAIWLLYILLDRHNDE